MVVLKPPPLRRAGWCLDACGLPSAMKGRNSFCLETPAPAGSSLPTRVACLCPPSLVCCIHARSRVRSDPFVNIFFCICSLGGAGNLLSDRNLRFVRPSVFASGNELVEATMSASTVRVSVTSSSSPSACAPSWTAVSNIRLKVRTIAAPQIQDDHPLNSIVCLRSPTRVYSPGRPRHGHHLPGQVWYGQDRCVRPGHSAPGNSAFEFGRGL